MIIWGTCHARDDDDCVYDSCSECPWCWRDEDYPGDGDELCEQCHAKEITPALCELCEVGEQIELMRTWHKMVDDMIGGRG